MLRENFKKIEEAILSVARSHYGDRLVSIVVYGSAARGTQRFDSDIDLLVIANGLPRGRMSRAREFEAVENGVEPLLDTLRGSGISTCISAVIKTPEESLMGSPLFLDMTEDSRVLFDRDGFFAAVLDRLKKRLKELGARRVWRGNVWYWEIKPDYKPGDIFDL